MPRDNGHDGTPQGVYGAELRYYRERAGLSQTDLAALVNVSHDVISKIETGDRAPAKEFPERLDAVPELDTRDGLARIWGNLSKGLRSRAIPGWFRPWAELEAAATALRSYEPLARTRPAPDRGLRPGCAARRAGRRYRRPDRATGRGQACAAGHPGPGEPPAPVGCPR